MPSEGRFCSFALFDTRVLLDCLWSAFLSPLELSGEPFGQLLAFQSASWAILGGSWTRLGGPKMLTWRSKAASGAQLGGPKRSKKPTWRSKVGLRAQFGGPKPSQELILEPKAVPGANFGGLERSKMPLGRPDASTWRSKAFEEANFDY